MFPTAMPASPVPPTCRLTPSGAKAQACAPAAREHVALALGAVLLLLQLPHDLCLEAVALCRQRTTLQRHAQHNQTRVKPSGHSALLLSWQQAVASWKQRTRAHQANAA